MSVISVSAYPIEEPMFGTLDYIPVVSSVAGVARFAFGLIEAALGAVVLPIQGVQRMFNVEQRFLFNLGISNMVRGKIAFIPIIGNLALYFYDHMPNTKSDVQNLFGLSKFS